MAQTQKPTILGYAEIAKLFASVTTAMAADGSGLESVVGLTGACTASEESTFANPGGATKLAANGFALVNADSVEASAGTVTLDHVFTCVDASQSVSGFAVENDDDDVVFAECCFNAALPCEVSDTVTVQMAIEFKLGA